MGLCIVLGIAPHSAHCIHVHAYFQFRNVLVVENLA